MNGILYGKRTKEQEGFPAEIFQLRTDSIRPNRSQPRAEFDHNAIVRLADSIRRYGILQPLTVRPADSDDDLYDYELIAGERRLRAAKMLGYFTVPCIIVRADEQMSAELAIIENLLREDLNMFEQAYGFRTLIENHGLTQEEVARRMSMSQSAVANKLRLLRLTYEEQKMILETGLTERHARAMLRIPQEDIRPEIIQKVASEHWNVAQTEAYIERMLDDMAVLDEFLKETKKKNEEKTAENEAEDILRALQRKLSRIKHSGRTPIVNVLQNVHTIDISIKIPR